MWTQSLALAASMLLGGCASQQTVGLLAPKPALAITLPAGGYELRLDEGIMDSFETPSGGAIGAVHVTAWRQTLRAGFFATEKQSEENDSWTIHLLMARLTFEEKKHDHAAAMLASREGHRVAHGGAHAPRFRAPTQLPVYARLDVAASLSHSSWTQPRAIEFTVHADQSVKEYGSVSKATQSAVEEMYEAMASKIVSSANSE